MIERPDPISAQRITRLQSYLDADPDNPRLLSQIADLFLQTGDTLNARPVLDRLTALQPDDSSTLYLMASLLFLERQFEQSLELTGNLLDASENHPVVRFQHARTLAQLERFEEAEPLLASLVAEAADVHGLPHLYIRTLHHLGKFDEAIDYALAHVHGHPDDTGTSGMLSLLYLDDDRLIEAALMAEQTLERSPNNLDAMVTLGFATLAFGEVSKASGCFRRAVELDASSGRASLGQALVAILGGDLATGRQQLERAIECMPLHLGTWNALAWVQLLQGDDEAATRTLQHSLRIDRRFGETYGALAVIAARHGKWEEAKGLSDKAIRLQPDGFAGRFARSLLLAHQGNVEQSRALMDLMLKGAAMPTGGSLDDMVRRFATAGPSRTPALPSSGTLPDGSPHVLH